MRTVTDSHHRYPIRMTWTGNTGTGTAHSRGYDRAHEYSVPGKLRRRTGVTLTETPLMFPIVSMRRGCWPLSA